MQSKVVASLFFVAGVLILPIAAGALGLDVQARGGAGVAGGTTTQPNITGGLGFAANGGIAADVYVFNAGPVSVGVSGGVEYALLNENSKTSQTLPAPYNTTVNITTATQYNYLYFPVAIVGNYALNKRLSITLHAGGFVGRFLTGKNTIDYSPQVPAAGMTNSTSTLTTSDTPVRVYGIHVSGGPSFSLGPNLSLSPSVELNWGLTNVSLGSSYTSTLWSVVGNVGITYTIF